MILEWSDLEDHLEYHESDTLFVCEECDREYDCYDGIYSHFFESDDECER